MSTAVPPPQEQNDPSRNRPASGVDRRHDNQRGDRAVAAMAPDTREVVRRQKKQFGGMRFGACFFGWLTATGTAVLLTAIITATGTALGLSQNVPGQAPTGVAVIGIGSIVVAAVVLVSYFAGGYVAGRMARFNGLKQGVGVWLWALIAAVVVAILGVVTGSQLDILSSVNGVPRIPLDAGGLTTGAVIAALVIAGLALLGAVLGGLAGMRFHRRVDHADLSDVA